MQIIAEVKTESPFGWRSSQSWDELFRIAEQVGDIISIHTDPRWGGSFDLLKKARRLTDKPILAKGIHASDTNVTKALECGADFVLVVGRVPIINTEACLIEPRTMQQLRDLDPSLKAVWNSRDLATGGLKTATFAEARKAFSGWLCQASNISKLDDIDTSADAILVGTKLPQMKSQLQRL